MKRLIPIKLKQIQQPSTVQFRKNCGQIKNQQIEKHQFVNLIKNINEKIGDKQIPYRLKKDYQQLQFLITYNQNLHKRTKLRQTKFKKLLIEKIKSQKQYSFDMVQKQIKNTNKCLKKSQFLNKDKSYIEDTTLDKISQLSVIQLVNNENISNIGSLKSNLIFQIKDKLTIFGNSLSQFDKHTLKNQIFREIKAIKNSDVRVKLKKYVINYVILQKFLRMLCQDSSKFINKSIHRELYMKIKEEMVSLATDQELCLNHYNQIKVYQTNKKNTFSKIQCSKKTIAKPYFKHRSKEDQLIEQIEKMLNKAKIYVGDALCRIGRQESAKELWNNNNELSKEQQIKQV